MKRIQFVTRARGGNSSMCWNPGDERVVKDDIAAGFQKAGVARIVEEVKTAQAAKEPIVETATVSTEEIEDADYRPRRGRKPIDD